MRMPSLGSIARSCLIASFHSGCARIARVEMPVPAPILPYRSLVQLASHVWSKQAYSTTLRGGEPLTELRIWAIAAGGKDGRALSQPISIRFAQDSALLCSPVVQLVRPRSETLLSNLVYGRGHGAVCGSPERGWRDFAVCVFDGSSHKRSKRCSGRYKRDTYAYCAQRHPITCYFDESGIILRGMRRS